MHWKFCSKHLERMICSFYIPDYISWKILSYSYFYCIIVKLILFYSNPTLAIKQTHLLLYLDLWKSQLHTLARPFRFWSLCLIYCFICVGYRDIYVIVHICTYQDCTCVYQCESVFLNWTSSCFIWNGEFCWSWSSWNKSPWLVE